MILKPYSVSPIDLTAQAEVRWKNKILSSEFQFKGDVGRIKNLIPFTGTRDRKDELWKSTCFEWFLKPAGAKSYLEFNAGPFGDWNLYSLTDYRQGLTAVPLTSVPKIEGISGKDSWTIKIDTDISFFPEKIETIHLNLAAVVENLSGEKTYWALAHPLFKPDFHDLECFVCTLREET